MSEYNNSNSALTIRPKTIQRLHAADYSPNSVLKIWSTDNLKTAGVDNSDSAPTIRSNNNIETACVNNHDSAVEINHVKDNTETVLIDESPFRSDVPHTPFLLKKSNLP